MPMSDQALRTGACSGVAARVGANPPPHRLFRGATRVRRPQNGVGDASTAGGATAARLQTGR